MQQQFVAEKYKNFDHEEKLMSKTYNYHLFFFVLRWLEEILNRKLCAVKKTEWMK